MPLRGEGHSDLVRDEQPYFDTLDELDTWFTQPHDKLSGVLPYLPRLVDGQSDNRGKLLICHDANYGETPSGIIYTFNFWRLCDTYVYFAHHRVTVPPSGFTNAAHKQGTRMLGTLVFEDFEGYQSDCLQLIIGRADDEVEDNEIPISKRYAVLLAELAYQRGFDGYLLNVETNLKYGTNQARALAAWMLLLGAELRTKVGPHAQVVWYDSVIYNGRLVWNDHSTYQNRVDGYNLPFFLASDTFFTNYWWTPQTQDSMTQYIRNLDTSTDATPSAATKILQNIYSGIDLYSPREGQPSQYGGGGFCCYRSMTYTSPRGISTAIFADDWTSACPPEGLDPKETWEWEWDRALQLWVGPIKPENIPTDKFPEDPFKPMTTFFRDSPPSDPSTSAFYTNFSLGVGFSWFVEGTNVLDTTKGWTDIDKQCSIGNLVWPSPTPSWHGPEQLEPLPTASTIIDMTDGYNGGNTLKLTLTYAEAQSDDTIKAIWLPVQSLNVLTRESLEARVIYKTSTQNDVELDIQVYVKSLSDEKNFALFTIGSATASTLSYGWTQQIITFNSTSTRNTTSVAVLGFIIQIKLNDPSAGATFSLSLGQLAVYPASPPPTVSLGTPSVTAAEFAPSSPGTGSLEGVLTWDTASTLQPVDISSVVVDMESTTPAWLLDDTPAYRFPTFVYFNIYIVPDSTQVVFIGTTGLDGRANRFYVDPACLPPDLDKWVVWPPRLPPSFDKRAIPFHWQRWAMVTFIIQGVTDRGEVLPLDRCASVDVVYRLA